MAEERNDDTSQMFFFQSHSITAEDITTMEGFMGPGVAVADDIRPNTLRIDFTEAVFHFKSCPRPIKITVPYKKMSIIDSTLGFPDGWTFQRAKAAGFIGAIPERDILQRKYLRELAESAVAKAMTKYNIKCTVCENANAVGHAITLFYEPSTDGDKGAFFTNSKEHWVCERENCLGRGDRRLRRENKKKDQFLCGNCAVNVENLEKKMRCSQCKKQDYCSKVCQVAHWEQHKPICRAIVKSKATLEDMTQK